MICRRKQPLYDINSEVEIAKAVAKKVMATSKNKQDAEKAYSETCVNRGVRFLQELDQKLEVLSNQEIADLLKMLLANGLNIENEEELEYWINLLETCAMLRLRQYFQALAQENPSEFSIKELKEFQSLLQVVIGSKKRAASFCKDPEQLRNLQDLLALMHKAEKLLNKNIKQRQTEPHKTKKSQRSENKSETDTLGLLQSKMADAGIESGGVYWNEVIASYESSMDRTDFVNSWSADQSRVTEEKNAFKKLNEKDDSEKQKQQEYEENQRRKNEEKENQKTDQNIKREKESKQMQNLIMIKRGFENPKNQQAVNAAANKKLEKTGQTLTEKDIKMIKVKIANNGR